MGIGADIMDSQSAGKETEMNLKSRSSYSIYITIHRNHGGMQLQRTHNRISSEMVIPSHMVPIVIGRGGETLKGIELACNVSVQLGDRPQDLSKGRKCVIVGEPDSVEQAKYVLYRIYLDL